MLKTDQIGAAIMAEVQKEVTAFLDKVSIAERLNLGL